MSIKKYQLDAEEQEILTAFESGELKSIHNLQAEKQKIVRAAKAHMNKVHRVNIRLNTMDFQRAQEKSMREGIPYATFIASIVHKYLSGQLVEQQMHS